MATRQGAGSNGHTGDHDQWLACIAVAAVFPLIAFGAPTFIVFGTHVEHALADLAIALSACFCSLQALTRYQSRPQPMFLWLAAGYLASGLLDVVHGVLGLQVGAAAGDRIVWAWTASSTVLGLSLAIGLARVHGVQGSRRYGLDAAIVGLSTATALIVLVPFLLNSTLRSPIWPDHALHRPGELAPALAMLFALLFAVRNRARLDAPLRRVLFVSLALYASLHLGVQAWSSQPLDTFVANAHLARFLAHWLMLVGLLQSSATLLADAEDSRQRLSAQAGALEASERRIRSLVHYAPYAILTADDAGKVQSINTVAGDVFRIRPEDAAGRPLASFFAGEAREEIGLTLTGEHAVRARLLQLQAGSSVDDTGRARRALSRETSGVRADGSTFPAALTMTDTIAGGQRFFTAFVRDLTRVVEQERDLRRAFALTSQVLDQSGVAICSTDADGTITRFNRTAQAWLGYGETEVVGRRKIASLVDPKQLQLHVKYLEREFGVPPSTDLEAFLALPRRNTPEQREWTMVRKNGSTFPAQVAVAPLGEPDGKINGFVLVASDLSHQKEVEKMKSEFVSTVSHELRTPLTSVRGSLGLLAGGLAGKLPAQAQTLLEIAQRNTERLILLINDILDIEKIEAGKMRFAMKSVDLDTLAAEAVQSAEGLAATRTVKLAFGTRAPGLKVHADDHRLIQVLSNLLSNAIKFSPPGSVVAIDVSGAGARARVTVTDRGTGIPESAQPKIFQKFFQADSSTSREKGGTGLGLSICKALIERMDGQMGFRSRPGETVFWFELPCEAAHAHAGGAAPRRVLVVEDDGDAAAVLCQILGQAGFETETADTAARARECLQRRRYDCVTLDVLLPDQDGVSLLGDLRRSEYGRKVPIIIVSIYDADDRMQAAAAAARISAWITKPVDAGRLLEAVRAAVPAAANAAGAREGGVLLVDDDMPMGELLRRLLADVAPVSVARTIAEGRQRIQQQPYALVILDIGLPDGVGRELLPAVQQTQPGTPVIIFSELGSEGDIEGQVVKVLSKSRTTNDELIDVVREILHRNKTEAADGAAAKNPAG